MKEYIEREAYISKHKLIDGILYELGASEAIGDAEEYAHWERVLYYVRKFPAADVEPVRSGRWVLTTEDDGYGEYQIYRCDKCGAITAQRRNYCPDCGAKMEVEI